MSVYIFLFFNEGFCTSFCNSHFILHCTIKKWKNLRDYKLQIYVTNNGAEFFFLSPLKLDFIVAPFCGISFITIKAFRDICVWSVPINICFHIAGESKWWNFSQFRVIEYTYPLHSCFSRVSVSPFKSFTMRHHRRSDVEDPTVAQKNIIAILQ